MRPKQELLDSDQLPQNFTYTIPLFFTSFVYGKNCSILRDYSEGIFSKSYKDIFLT